MLDTKFLVIAFFLPFVYTNCRFPNANQLSAHSQRLYSQAPAKIPYLPYIILKPNSYVSIGNEKGKTYKFKFTATDNEFITIETFGREDTKLKVYNSSNKKFLTDDDSGEDRNARIGFLATKNTDYFIYSKLYQQEKGGNYSIQLRRQNFAMFGCNIPNDINTAPDFDYPSYLYSNTYECHKYINKSAEDARKEDQRRLAPLNSELVFFSGHGIAYKNAGTGYGVEFYKNGAKSMLTLDDDFSLSETKVAMWAACESANNNNDKGISFAQYAQSKGAKSSIGFSVDISCSASRKFTNFFFMELAMGRSVLEAAQFGASRLNWAWDNGNCKIFGDTATKVTTNTGSNVSFMPRTPISKKQLTELKSPAYISHDLGFNIKRYYKTINGYISDEYVDLYSDTSNQPSYMKKHHTNAKSVLPIRKDVLSKYVISLPRINREESHIVYCNFNQKMTPILLGYQRIHEGKKASRNVRCINLYDGLPVDYKKIV